MPISLKFKGGRILRFNDSPAALSTGKESGRRKQIGQFLQSIQIFLVRSRYNPFTISAFPATTYTVGYFLLQVFQGFPYY
ncbi:hypothetical protein HHI98_01125 [Akkermansia muciniphila]|nr:hypothetical protein [Akkermansia muciniphila]